jgi:DNA-binding NtrC family response regulator
VDVRVLAATNIPVEQLMEGRGFREDLFYRINVFTIRIAPLRERREDIPLLAAHFLTLYAAENGKPLAGFSDEAMERMMSHDWPGNARELRNAVQRAAILCAEGEIESRHLPETVRGRPRLDGGGNDDGAVRIPLGTTIEDAERALILGTLRANGGNKTRSAAVLGVSAKTLYSKLRRYEEENGEDAS